MPSQWFIHCPHPAYHDDGGRNLCLCEHEPPNCTGPTLVLCKACSAEIKQIVRDDDANEAPTETAHG